jgi:hypothetical protein
MAAGAGAIDESARRWRLFLSAIAWLLIVQSALGVLSGIFSLAMRSLLVPSGATGFPPELVPFDVVALVRGTRSLIFISPFANLALLAGAIGLLKRWKWGWYVVVLLHAASLIGLFAWGFPLVRAAIEQLAPGGGFLPALGITALMAVMPVVVIVVLMLKGITDQFERA